MTFGLVFSGPVVSCPVVSGHAVSGPVVPGPTPEASDSMSCYSISSGDPVPRSLTVPHSHCPAVPKSPSLVCPDVTPFLCSDPTRPLDFGGGGALFGARFGSNSFGAGRRFSAETLCVCDTPPLRRRGASLRWYRSLRETAFSRGQLWERISSNACHLAPHNWVKRDRKRKCKNTGRPLNYLE